MFKVKKKNHILFCKARAATVMLILFIDLIKSFKKEKKKHVEIRGTVAVGRGLADNTTLLIGVTGGLASSSAAISSD